MKTRIFLDLKNKHEIKSHIKIEVKFWKYKKILGKKFKFLFYNLSKILEISVSNQQCAQLDLKLVNNIYKVENWISCMKQFLNLNLLSNLRIHKNLAIFLFYSWQIYLQRFKFRQKLFDFEDRRRDAFNNLSLEWIKTDPNFNIKIIEILRRWK
ncbi:hypothetical protein [Mesomycoplasma ovipneumoniae]|uniref:hypothetical protein n=1 Tax=Mesomycoplasma ovipneumoniae TaxID=29562 RepID=UPI00083E7F88|nr:hypothetical protein [Mesomycoplasma ovipneumoniae]MDW2923210.1 hypothetical protein [Mesomycoplasma ovipneumoniae]MDW2930303.1 hypothetical protein [Mesomycoplasma ovipneumoniae]WDV48771.1 hypothetical protein PWA39_00565 [Mesomycoplasma ovipneumoniae ATCC 29419]WHF53585.1 hypothetical protein QJQ40_00490 [Mesomycoplasma ovipneumoniae]